jgi:tetratricopeptide (TPR) repeat protein
MNKFNSLIAKTIAAALLFVMTVSHSADPQLTVKDLRARWAVAKYQLQDKAQQEAFEDLRSDAERFTAEHPNDTSGWIWSGIIKSTYAGAKGGLGALGLAKAARRDLETALKLDDRAMQGSAYTSLGTLYFNVPGWPLGFGSDKKAEKMLRKGLEINPDGIDSNYFFAEFLRDQGDSAEARVYYLRAKAATPRPERPVADQGRQQEIDAALAELGAE